MTRESESDSEARFVELGDLTLQPGTYFNPRTEVLVVVDDSTSIDQGIFGKAVEEGAEWVRVSEEVPIDEVSRDELLEEFETTYHPGASGAPTDAADDLDLDIDRELEYDDDSDDDEDAGDGDDKDESDEQDSEDDESDLEELAL